MIAQRAKQSSNPEPTCWALARDPARAARLAGLLSAEGCAAAADLEGILERAPAVLVVDPEGWEEPCRRALEGFEQRPAPPPAVLFVGADPLVLHTAGPAYAHLTEPLDRGRLAVAVARLRGRRARFSAGWPRHVEAFPAAELRRVKEILERATGLAIGADRETSLRRALGTRMVARLIPGLRGYAEYLARHGAAAGETELLAGLLTVGETYFWRYAGQFGALGEVLLPALTRGGPVRHPRRLRLWAAGCASGEEAYSLAIAGLEAAPPGWEISVVGTDLHRPSLARAEAGVYEARALRNLPTALRRKYLRPDGDAERVGAALRRCVRFEVQNLQAEEVSAWADREGPFDAIFCRNTLIYFARRARQRIVERLEAALVPGGGLFLGASEILHPRRPALEPVRSMGSFLYRKTAPPAPAPPAELSPGRDSVGERAARLYRRGLECLDAEEFAAARARFQEILSLRPEDARGHTGVALLLANEGREAEAAAHLERALGVGPRLAETAYLSGLLAERRGLEVQALQHYAEALEMAPGFFMAHLNRAWILRRLGRGSAARRELRLALRLLQERPRVAPWLTGGVGGEALLDLVADALAEEGAPT